MLYYKPMSYAVIQLQGKQYKVQAGDELVVNKLDLEVGKTLEISDVLLMVDGKKVKLGQPFVKDAKVKLEVLEHGKGEKIRVAKYKAKSRYRKVKGHRQHLTKLKVLKLT